MSRIFDTPRYRNQTLYKVLSHIDIYLDTNKLKHLRSSILVNFGQESIRDVENSAYAHELGEYRQYDYELLMRAELEEQNEEDLYAKYSYEQGLLRRSPQDHMQVVATGRVMSKILRKCMENNKDGSKKIWCDSDASYRLVHSYLSGKYKAKLSNVDRGRKSWATSMAKDIATVGMVACRMGQISLDNTVGKCVLHRY
jgi:hypothetical protein